MVKKGQQYKHYKGSVYEVLDVAEHTETGEKFVIYFNINIPERIWARPYEMFIENIPDGRKRFGLI
ncbi:MAG: DUF1653 domain-containing protein [Lactobacillaceae bacterium]|jgi:hypothetical protein|nr:DUF1653 domain-containing protein [Lactobacillaceae bacterium]